MAPRHSGETLTEADGDKSRYRPSGLGGAGAIGRADMVTGVFTGVFYVSNVVASLV